MEAGKKSLEELFKAAEVDLTNPFEAACWAQVERFFHEFPPPQAVPLALLGEGLACTKLYSVFVDGPTEETLTALTTGLDEFLPKFEKAYGKKWNR